jgi:hypothetical protein
LQKQSGDVDGNKGPGRINEPQTNRQRSPNEARSWPNEPCSFLPRREVSGLFAFESIPASFVYDRSGKLVAEALDMRTHGQFLKMLAQAGLR